MSDIIACAPISIYMFFIWFYVINYRIILYACDCWWSACFIARTTHVVLYIQSEVECACSQYVYHFCFTYLVLFDAVVVHRFLRLSYSAFFRCLKPAHIQIQTTMTSTTHAFLKWVTIEYIFQMCTPQPSRHDHSSVKYSCMRESQLMTWNIRFSFDIRFIRFSFDIRFVESTSRSLKHLRHTNRFQSTYMSMFNVYSSH